MTAGRAVSGQPVPCNAQGIAYKAYAREFQQGAPPVIYVFASCWMENSVSEVFFVRERGLRWTLMQRVPTIIDTLLTYYQASATTAQPTLGVGQTIEVVDAFGTHHVPVEPWNFLNASRNEAAPSAEHVDGATNTIQPSRGGALDYKVFGRVYDEGGGAVLFLFATCYYPTGMWNIFFRSEGNLRWTLLEKVPGFANQLVTYYVASTTTAFGVGDFPPTVTIIDGYGAHTVPVEAWQLEKTVQVPKRTAARLTV